MTDMLLYRLRYFLGYSSLIILFTVAITAASLYVPGGLSQPEINTLHITNSLHLSDIGSLAVPNLPLHALQKFIFSYFGVSVYTAKLPALIFAFITAVAIFLLLRRWFKPNVTIISLIIMVMTGQIIYIAQSASPQILYLMYTSLILLFATLIVQRVKAPSLWRICLAISIALSLYTPYFWYINLGLGFVAFIHPHIRYFIFGRRYRLKWSLIAVVFAILITPLIYFCLINPHLLTSLLGFTSLQWTITSNLKALAYTYFWFAPTIINGQVMPIMDVAALILVLYGIFETIKNHHTARSYMLAVWLILALPLLVLRPTLFGIMLIPLFILLAVGVEALMRSWYSLFPKNPYARAAGLILVVALVSIMTLSGADRYINSYRYIPAAVNEFNTDLPLLRQQLQKTDLTVIVSSAEAPIYQAAAAHPMAADKQLTVLTRQPEQSKPDTIYAVSAAARSKGLAQPHNATLLSILTNDRQDSADRFYLYKSPAK